MKRDPTTVFESRAERQGGYLLVETLAASAILLVALLAIMPLFTMAMRQNAYAKDVTVASDLALDKLEETGASGVSAR